MVECWFECFDDEVILVLLCGDCCGVVFQIICLYDGFVIVICGYLGFEGLVWVYIVGLVDVLVFKGLLGI